jgi:hypothetical protein
MKVRRAISIVGLLLVVAGIYVFLNSGFRELPPIFFWGLILLLFRFFLSRRGLGWKIAAFVVGWFELATLIGAFIRAVYWSSHDSSHYSNHYSAVLWWAQLIISAVVSGALVYYLPFGPITAVSEAEHVPDPTDAS